MFGFKVNVFPNLVPNILGIYGKLRKAVFKGTTGLYQRILYQNLNFNDEKKQCKHLLVLTSAHRKTNGVLKHQ